MLDRPADAWSDGFQIRFPAFAMDNTEFPAGERGAFSDDALRSPTLPARYYVDPRIYRRELEAIFHRGWVYVGHVSQFARRGDFLVTQVADQGIFILRDDEGELRAFYNVCRHRGHELLQDAGRLSKNIVCPYHAWCYGFDGGLRRARNSENMRDFDPARFALEAVRLADCAGLLFANLDPNADDFAALYPGLAATFAAGLPDLDRLGVARQFDYDIAANWKVVVDNFSEGYHIPVAHRQLSRVLDIGRGNRSRVEANYAFFESLSGAGYDGYRVEPGSPYRSWTLWPNTCLLSLPGCANLIVIRMAPNGVGGCREHVDLLAPGGTACGEFEAIADLFASKFNAEDIAIVESVQRGLGSRGYDQGRYVVDPADDWYSESGLHRFHRRLLAALAGA